MKFNSRHCGGLVLSVLVSGVGDGNNGSTDELFLWPPREPCLENVI